MIINVHAGHNPDSKVACGAVGFILESTEARRVKDEVINKLRQLGHTVYDCTCENGTSKTDILKKIVASCNAHKVDLDVSIHFNSGAKDKSGNGKTTGVEVLVYSASSKANPFAEKVCKAVSSLGFKNRGIKYRSDLAVLKNTKAPSMLVECCFVDDKDDVQLYHCQEMAEAIVLGITGQRMQISAGPADQDAAAEGVETAVSNTKRLYRVQVGAYSAKRNADAMLAKIRGLGIDAVIVSG